MRFSLGVTTYLEMITAQNAALADEVTAMNILGKLMSSAVCSPKPGRWMEQS